MLGWGFEVAFGVPRGSGFGGLEVLVVCLDGLAALGWVGFL